MLVDLLVRGKVALVFGGGAQARARSTALAREGARVVRVPEPSATTPAARKRPAGKERSSWTDPTRLMRQYRPALVVSVLMEEKRNRAIVDAAHAVGALVHVFDRPALSDISMPSVGSAGPIRVAVSTSGQSPAMAAILRRRLERRIRPEDVARVRLQKRLRGPIFRSLPEFEMRKEAIYRILRHPEIGRLLRAGRNREAATVARRVIDSRARRRAPSRVRGRR